MKASLVKEARLVTRPRRTQLERSALTRQLVCEAALDALVDFGASGVSTGLVANLAGVSRGALTHQFPTRNDMFVAAYQYLIEGWRSSALFSTSSNDRKLSISEFVDELWSLIYEPRRYTASVELMLASSKDDDLGKKLRSVLHDWASFRDAAALEILGANSDDKKVADVFYMTLALMRGVAVMHKLSADNASVWKQLSTWKLIAQQMLSSNAPFPASMTVD